MKAIISVQILLVYYCVLQPKKLWYKTTKL